MTLPAVIKVEQTTGFDGLPATVSAQQWGQDRPVTLFTDGTLAIPDGIVKPNIGRSIRDVEATDGDSESLTSWQERNNVDPSKQVRLLKLAHMRYQHPDLDTITIFLKDFGMHIAQKSADGTKIWFRGYGPDQYVYYAQKGEKEFLGGAFEVESMAELEKASQIVGASGLMEMKDAPGGGHLVTLTDPEGFKINLIYGLSPADPAPECFLPAKLLHNNEQDKPRVRAFNRYSPGPAAVHKLGHYGLCVRDFDEQLKWYTTHFNLAPTDFLYVVAPDENNRTTDRPAKKNVGLFAHIDRGDQPVDHHTFFMTSNPTSHVHHCSFEVHDYDTQHLGHQWLANKQYTSVWGIGRHILGSQVFDYWWDTTGNMIEHYADGDLVNNDTPIGWSNAGDESLAVWGPEVPKWFLE